MSVLYNKVERGNPQNPASPKKYYAVLKVIKQIAEKEVAELIADETTLNPNEAAMAVRQLKKILIRLLLDGYSVQLGDWGSFHLTCNSEGRDTREEVDAHSIKRANVRFMPGKEVKEAIAKAEFLPAESLVTKEKER
jgi:predicted histone-like DNA-binding protein